MSQPRIIKSTKGPNVTEYKIAKDLSEGANSKVYEVTGKETQGKLIAKVMKLDKDSEADFQKSQAVITEVELLKRIYPKTCMAISEYERTNKGTGENEIYEHSTIIMPMLEGKLLQDNDNKVPAELTTLTFQERADLAVQLFTQMEAMHAPTPPAKPAIVVDIHGGNIMVDFEKNELHLFDLGSAILVNSTQLVDASKYIETNAVARAPETVTKEKIGLVSDIYGLVAPIMLLWGASNPGEEKAKLSGLPGPGKSSEDIFEDIIASQFSRDGLLGENIEIPPFVIPLNYVIEDLIKRMEEKDPEERLQTVTEAKEFFSILQNISTADAKAEAFTQKDEENAFKLIALAAGCGNICKFLPGDKKLQEFARGIVSDYREQRQDNADLCSNRLRDKYLQLILLLKLQLVNLLNELSEQATNREKRLAFSRYRDKILAKSLPSPDSKDDVRNQFKQMCETALKQICKTALERTTPGFSQSHSGEILIKLLNDNKEEYAGLISLLKPSESDRVDVKDIYRFLGSSGNPNIIESVPLESVNLATIRRLLR